MDSVGLNRIFLLTSSIQPDVFFEALDCDLSLEAVMCQHSQMNDQAFWNTFNTIINDIRHSKLQMFVAFFVGITVLMVPVKGFLPILVEGFIIWFMRGCQRAMEEYRTILQTAITESNHGKYLLRKDFFDFSDPQKDRHICGLAILSLILLIFGKVSNISILPLWPEIESSRITLFVPIHNILVVASAALFLIGGVFLVKSVQWQMEEELGDGDRRLTTTGRPDKKNVLIGMILNLIGYVLLVTSTVVL
jgi:hypothetical protein